MPEKAKVTTEEVACYRTECLLTREAKMRLAEMGVVAKTIQVGEPSGEDVDKFRRVCGNDGLP